MKSINKIVIFLSIVAMTLVIGNFVYAQGKGYFLEKGEEFFVFDNLYISGFLTVGKNLIGQPAKNGDVIVQNQFILDENNSFTFCKDVKQTGAPFAPLNTDCNQKVLVWYADPNIGLKIMDPNFYQLKTNNIETSNTIKFSGQGDMFITKPIKSTGGSCFSNDDSGDCTVRTTGLVETQKIWIKSLAALGGNELFLDAQNVDFSTIDLGQASDFDNFNICWKSSVSCPSNANGGQDYYRSKDYSTFGFDGIRGTKICCHLKVNY